MAPYLYEFKFYTGKKSNPELGLGESVVKDLTQSLAGTCCRIYMDNFFTTVNLFQDLFDIQILACGTIRVKRKYLPDNLKKDKNMKRGEHEYRQSGCINLVKWMDSKSVLVLSNTCCGPVTSGSVKRRQKGSIEKVAIDCPEIIQDYNTNMGGVDLLDQKISTYSLDRRSQIKFYLGPFFDLLDIVLINSYVVWKSMNPKSNLTSLDFRRSVTRDLILLNSSRDSNAYRKRSKKQGSLSVVSAGKHLPEITSIRRRCQMCSDADKDYKTYVRCNSCEKYFCFTNTRNCYKDFHNNI